MSRDRKCRVVWDLTATTRLLAAARIRREHPEADELVAAGVPHDRIVLVFRPPQMRRYTDFAAA